MCVKNAVVRVFTTCGVAVAAAAALYRGTDYGIWIHSGPGWRRKAADDGSSAAEPGERRRRMKVKTGDSALLRGAYYDARGRMRRPRENGQGCGKTNAGRRRRMP